MIKSIAALQKFLWKFKRELVGFLLKNVMGLEEEIFLRIRTLFFVI